MKKNLTTFAIAVFALTFTLGCSWINPFSGSDSASSDNKTFEDKAVETAVGDEKIGIPECDAVVDELAAQMRSEDEGYIVKAFRQYYINAIREAIKRSVAENKGDPEKLAAECTKIKAQLDKYRAEEEAKK